MELSMISSEETNNLLPNMISIFWKTYDDQKFDHDTRENNTTDFSLFTFDILKSLNQREQDFLIHARLGHIPRKKILQLIKNGTTGIETYSGKFKELCKPCMQAKHRAENHGHEHSRHPEGKPGEHLHSDLAVVSTLDISGNKYVLTVVDEISKEIIIALLKIKTAEEVCNTCKRIYAIITARTKNKLLTWQFDRGTEFLNSKFSKWILEEIGATQRFSNIEHPWENGIAERSFETIFGIARSLLKHADLPNKLWGKAVLHSVYLKNRTPSETIGGIAPMQYRTKEKIDISNLRVFGCPAQIHVRATRRDDNKLSDRSESGTFVGMSQKGNGYIFLVARLNKIIEIDSKDVKFNETFSDCRERKGQLSSGANITSDLFTEKEANEATNSSSSETQKPEAEFTAYSSKLRPTPKQIQFLLPGTHSTKAKQIFKEPEIQKADLCLSPEVEFLSTCIESQIEEETFLLKELELLMACFNPDEEIALSSATNEEEINLDIPDPKTQSDIDKMHPRDAKRFNEATLAEVKGMKQKGVIEYVTMDQLPPDTKVYQSIVNWSSKTNLGVYVKTKCRICFGGHRYDKSYSDTFAPTVNFCTVLIMICLGAMFGWYLGGLDYSQAYLNADLNEVCVMKAPIAVREYDENAKEYFWLMKKAIYGHPKASRLWGECLHKKLIELGYEQFLTDQCVYGRWNNWNANEIKDNIIPRKSSFIFLLIHSDDIIIISHDENLMNSAKAELLKVFDGTDNGELKSFCGVEVKIKNDKISLSMEYYWNKLMKKFNVAANETEDSPIKTKVKRSDCPETPNEKLKNNYLQVIGSIIYGFTHCRLDLAFPVNVMTRVMHAPAQQHLDLLMKLLRYINGTKNWTLNYFKDITVLYGMDFVFYCCVDSAHADDDETFRSTGGWFFFLRKGQGSVAAKSGQTKDIPLSSTESETIWGSNATMQGAFIKQFLDELKIFKSTTFELHEDSQPMINAQKRNVSQSRFKHMKTKHHFIRKMIFDGWCKLVKIPTKMNTADMATKILPSKTVSIFSKVVLGIEDDKPDHSLAIDDCRFL